MTEVIETVIAEANNPGVPNLALDASSTTKYAEVEMLRLFTTEDKYGRLNYNMKKS
jgi:hypothetical protein